MTVDPRELLSVLRKCEYADKLYRKLFCPLCGHNEGHATDCALAALVRRCEEEIATDEHYAAQVKEQQKAGGGDGH